MDDLEEDQLISGKFRVLDLVGRDQNANVYNVQEGTTSDVFTVKVFHVHGQAPLEELKTEVELLKKLDHKSISRIRHSGTLPDGRPYLLLEPCKGQSLAEAIRKQRSLPEAQVIDIALLLCDAVTHAWARGVLLRDMNPSDIFLVQDSGDTPAIKPAIKPTIKIVDFASLRKITRVADQRRMVDLGFAMHQEDLSARAPEEFHGKNPDIRSAVYSLGIIIYQSLVGSPPFAGGTYAEIADSHTNENPPPFSLARPDLTMNPHLEAVVMKCLAKDPEHRYQNPDELKYDLYLVAEGQAPLAVTSPILPESSPERYKAPPGEHPRDNTQLWIAGITAVLISAVVINWNQMPRKVDFDNLMEMPQTNEFATPGGLSPFPTLRKGEELDLKGNEAQAMKMYGIAAGKARDSKDSQTASQALFRLAQIMHRKEIYAQAEQLAREALAISLARKSSFDPAEAQCLLAILMAERERFDDAAAAIAAAEKHAGTQSKFRLELTRARVLELKGEVEPAEKVLLNLKSATSDDGLNQELNHELACLYIRHGRFTDAQKLLTPVINENGPVRLALDLATAYLWQRKLDEASQMGMVLYSQDLAEHQINTDVARIYGICLAAHGHTEEALATLKSYATTDDIDDLEATIDLARIYGTTGQWQTGARILDRMATQTQWQRFMLNQGKAAMLASAGKFQEAERASDLALAAYDQSIRKDCFRLLDALYTRQSILEALGDSARLKENQERINRLPPGPVFLDPAKILRASQTK